MNHLSHEFFSKLPKTDLHCHLDGSLRIETLIELAEKSNVPLPSQDTIALKEALGLGKVHANLAKYLEVFAITCKVMQTREAIERVAFELVEDAANENVWHLEVRFCPTLLVHESLSAKEVVESVLLGLNSASKAHNITTGLIICGLKHFSPRTNLELAKLAVDFRHLGVVGFDLAGPEDGYPSRDHKESCYHAITNHLGLTIHAGESFGPKSISQAMFDCGTHRIGHGARLAEDQDLLTFIVDRRVPLELCISSNLHTCVMPELAKHPIRRLFDLGVRVTLNTDNRLVSDTNLTKEYEILHKMLWFNVDEIRTVVINGFKSAFLPYEQRCEYIANANKVIDQLL